MDSKDKNVITVFLKQITFSRSFGSKPQVLLKTNKLKEIQAMAQIKNKRTQ